MTEIKILTAEEILQDEEHLIKIGSKFIGEFRYNYGGFVRYIRDLLEVDKMRLLVN